jgi:hypothetical protein
MNDVPAQAFVALGAITAAFIAGFFSFLNLITSKEQKVSEFRQEWIDAFRCELSELTAALFHIKYYLDAYSFDSTRSNEAQAQTIASTLRDSHETYSRTVTSLLLRVNPSEKNKARAALGTSFLATFQALRDSFNQGNYSKACDLSRELRERAIPLLKSEWVRVKKGELVYRVSKGIAAALIVIALVGLGIASYNWSKHLIRSAPPTTHSTPKPDTT